MVRDRGAFAGGRIVLGWDQETRGAVVVSEPDVGQFLLVLVVVVAAAAAGGRGVGLDDVGP
jgi:hypothetical protein